MKDHPNIKSAAGIGKVGDDKQKWMVEDKKATHSVWILYLLVLVGHCFGDVFGCWLFFI